MNIRNLNEEVISDRIEHLFSRSEFLFQMGDPTSAFILQEDACELAEAAYSNEPTLLWLDLDQ